jgi:uncharacterized protein (UPF0548 family)
VLLLAEYAAAPLTYAQVGLSLDRDRPLPHGWGASECRVRVGAPVEPVLAAGRAAIQDWAAHRAARVHLEPPRPALREGTVLAVTAGPPVGAVVALCRIVRVVDEPDRFGFAYGTLPLHPEVGEECFLVTREPDGVWVRVRSASKPVALPARLAPPLARAVIGAYVRVYAYGLARDVRRRLATGG